MKPLTEMQNAQLLILAVGIAVVVSLYSAIAGEWERIEGTMFRGYSPEARANDPTCPLYGRGQSQGTVAGTATGRDAGGHVDAVPAPRGISGRPCGAARNAHAIRGLGLAAPAGCGAELQDVPSP